MEKENVKISNDKLEEKKKDKEDRVKVNKDNILVVWKDGMESKKVSFFYVLKLQEK